MVVTCFFVICTFGAIKFKQPERHMDERDNEGKNPSCLLSQTCHQTSQELRMLSSVTINCQVTKIVMNSGSQLSVL